MDKNNKNQGLESEEKLLDTNLLEEQNIKKIDKTEQEYKIFKEKYKRLKNKSLFKRFLNDDEDILEVKIKKLDKALQIESDIDNIEYETLKTNTIGVLAKATSLDSIEKNIKKIKEGQKKIDKVSNDITQAKILVKQISKEEGYSSKKLKKIKLLKSSIYSLGDEEASLFGFNKESALQLAEKELQRFKEKSKEFSDILAEKQELFQEQSILRQEYTKLKELRNNIETDSKLSTEEKTVKLDELMNSYNEKNKTFNERLAKNNNKVVDNSIGLEEYQKSLNVLQELERGDFQVAPNNPLEDLKKTNLGKFIITNIKEDKAKKAETYSKNDFYSIADKLNNNEPLNNEELKIFEKHKDFIEKLKVEKSHGGEEDKDKVAASVKKSLEEIGLKEQQGTKTLNRETKEAMINVENKTTQKNIKNEVRKDLETSISLTERFLNNDTKDLSQEEKTNLLEKLDKNRQALKNLDSLEEGEEGYQESLKGIVDNSKSLYNELYDIEGKQSQRKGVGEKVGEEIKKAKISLDADLEKSKNVFTDFKEKLDILELDEVKGGSSINVEEHRNLQNSRTNIRKQAINKKAEMAASNIGKEIGSIQDKIKEERKKAVVDERLVAELEVKMDSYKDLRSKLKDPSTSDMEKEGLISMLGNGEWLKEYISHRSENIQYNQEYVERELRKSKNKDYANLEENFYVNLYKNSVEDGKYTLVEEFSKLKNTIPGLEHVGLQDDLVKVASSLGLNDEETNKKLKKLVDIQETIQNYSMDTYTDSFLEKVYNKSRGIEAKMVQLEQQKESELREIDNNSNLDQHGKERRKSIYLDNYDNKMQEYVKSKEAIDTEIGEIQSLSKSIGKFSQGEIDNMSKNLKLFSIVSDFDNYGGIISGLQDDIVNGNTQFIDFKSGTGADGDIYTTDKVHQIVKSQIKTLQDTINLIENDPKQQLNKKKYIKKVGELKGIIDKIDKGDLQEEDVASILSMDTLYEFAFAEDRLEFLQKILDPSTTPEEKAKLTQDYKNQKGTLKEVKESNRKRLKELKSKLKLAKPEERELIKKEIELLEGFSESYQEKIFGHFDINKKFIQEELQDGYSMFQDSSYKQGLKSMKERANRIGRKGKLAGKLLFDGADVHTETDNKIRNRNQNLEKYLGAAFSGGFAGIIQFIFVSLNYITNELANIGERVKELRKVLEANRVNIFIFIITSISLITIFAGKDTYNFLDVNTHLFSVGDYQKNSQGIIEFAGDKSQSGDLGILGSIYYKSNIFLFFMYMVVIYQIIIEFMHKYIELLKDPRKSGDVFIRRSMKLLVIIVMLGLIFRVESIF